MARDEYFMDKAKKTPWPEVRRVLEAFGWSSKRDDRQAKIFVKGVQRLAILRMGKNKWKVKFFWRNKVSDNMGINDEEKAKILAAEFGVLNGMGS